MCVCDNGGHPALGAACPKDGTHKCVACSGKFFLNGHTCTAHTDCAAKGKAELKAGTNISDAECSPCSPADHERVKPGEFLFTAAPNCTAVRCSNAGAGEYYTGIGSPSAHANVTGDCARASCDRNLLSNKPGQFFVAGWANSSSSCSRLVVDCPHRHRVPPGYKFGPGIGLRFPARQGVCSLVKCAPKQPGRYFDGRGICSTSACASVAAGFRFVSGWTDRPTDCPIERCPEGRRGTYFVRGCQSANCSVPPVGGGTGGVDGAVRGFL